MNLVRVSEGLIFFLLGGLVFSLPAFAYDRPCVPMSKSYDLIFQGRLGLRYELVQTDASTLGLQWRKWSLTDYYSGNPKLDLMCSMYPGSYARSEVISFYDTKIWKGDHRPEGPYNAIKIMGGDKASFRFIKSDDTYLVYASKAADGSYYVERCSPTQLAERARDKIKALGNPVYEETSPYYQYDDPGLVYRNRSSKDGHSSHTSYWRNYVDQYRSLSLARRPCADPVPVDVVFIGDISHVELKGKEGKSYTMRTHGMEIIVDVRRQPFYPWAKIDFVSFGHLELYYDSGRRLQNYLEEENTRDRFGRKIPREEWETHPDLKPKKEEVDFNSMAYLYRHLAPKPKEEKTPKWMNGTIKVLEHTENSYEFAEVASQYYLVRASWLENGKLHVDRCSGTRPIESVGSKELKALGPAIFKGKYCYTCERPKRKAQY
ncbi:MAG: hypothetical protein KDD68_18220 [Bdellovibrionales bacterium]|nr:hypothetical protein [Bdellovibrionales bacterium]